MITGTYNLAVDPLWKNVQQQEIFLECDTTLAPVTINLFEIADLNRFWGVKIIISDKASNAFTNNIIINTSGSDTIDDDTTVQIVLDTNGESIAFQVAGESQWIALESVAGTSTSYNLVVGNPTPPADPLVSSDLQKISGMVTIQGTVYNQYRLKATIKYNGSSNIYANYIGLITTDLGTVIASSETSGVLICTDSGLTGTITSPLAVNGYVTNSGLGTSENIPFILLNPDNTIGTPNQYYLFFLAGNPNNFEADAILDVVFLTDSTNVTYTQNV